MPDPYPDFNTDPDVQRWLTSPGLAARARRAVTSGQMSEHVAAALVADIRQFRRALNGDRINPAEYMADPRLPTPAPFAPREEFIPDRAPGTKAHAVLRTAVQNIDADNMTRALQRRMGSDAQPPEASTWERADPSWRPPAPAADIDAHPATLRESVAAAFTAHTGNEE